MGKNELRQGQGQGQGQDHEKARCRRAALQLQMVLGLTLALTLTLPWFIFPHWEGTDVPRAVRSRALASESIRRQ